MTGTNTASFKPWLQQRIIHKKLVDEYVKQFETTETYERAQRAGYQFKLMDYVKEVAMIEAQMMHPTNALSYRSSIVFEYLKRTEGQDYEAECASLWRVWRDEASKGKIFVPVSMELIDLWEQLPAPPESNSIPISTVTSEESTKRSETQKNDVEGKTVENYHQPPDTKCELSVDDYF